MYMGGIGVPKDEGTGVQWTLMSAKQGDAIAEDNLGWAYEAGIGVRQDYAAAADWYKKAAEQGIARSQNNLAGLYLHGRGVPQDLAAAARWVQKAAEHGFPGAQYNLGMMYVHGDGVPPNRERGIQLLRGAASNGSEEAKRALQAMGQSGPESRDWLMKAGWLSLASYRSLGVECEGVMQGLMLVVTDGHYARLAPEFGRPLVYVDYLQTAPWNDQNLVDTPRFGAVGSRLLDGAVKLSVDLGYAGRIGLHSLPASEGFYRRLGVPAVEIERQDRHARGLWYFELTTHGAAKFLQMRGQT